MNNADELFITTFKCDIEQSRYSKLINDHMQSATSETKDFIDKYFNRFFLITKIGKSIYKNNHSNNGTEGVTEIQLEYLSALFAKTYFEYKNENDYLHNIHKRLEMLVKMHGQEGQNGIEKKYEIYKSQKEYQHYASFHFSVVLKSFEKKTSLEEVLRIISNGTCSKINDGIILRKGLNGIELVNECVQTIMELNYSIPAIEIQYVDVFDAMFEKHAIEID